MLCPTCQTAIQTNWYFCRQCGTALAARKAQPVIADSSLNDNLLGALALLSQPGQPQPRQNNDAWDLSQWSEEDLLKAKYHLY